MKSQIRIASSLIVALGSLAATPALAAPAEEGRRFALVIGNDAYSGRPLKNAVNDARAIDKALRAIGFKTILRENATKTVMEEATAELVQQLGPEDTALFFYAGHGVQIENENFLVPVEFEAASSVIQAKFRALSLGLVIESLKSRHAKRNIFILDACRSNPLSEAQALQGGLAIPLNAGNETFLSFSTSPNHVATDNLAGNNSWFTEALAELIPQPGLSIEDIFRRVGKRVQEETGGKQVPWVQSSLTASFYFNRPAQGDAQDDSTFVEKWMDDALRHEHREDWDRAIELMNQVLKKKPGGALEMAAAKKLPCLIARRDAQARLEAGNYGAAAASYEEAYKCDPFSVAAAFGGVNSYLLNDNFEGAVHLLKAIRVRGSSAALAKANAMLTDLGTVYPDAAKEIQSGIPQPPPIQEVLSGVALGPPEWSAAKRHLESVPIDLARWQTELTAEAPPANITLTPGSDRIIKDSGPPAKLAAPVTLDSLHVEIVSSFASRDLLIRRVGSVKLNTGSASGKAGVPVKVTTVPAGANLTVDGDPEQHCESPCILTLAPSKQIIQVRLDGFRPESRVIETPNSGESLEIALQQEVGFLVLEGPSGSIPVLLDGKPMSGQVPARVQLAAGKYQIRTVQQGKVTSQKDVEVRSLTSVSFTVTQ